MDRGVEEVVKPTDEADRHLLALELRQTAGWLLLATHSGAGQALAVVGETEGAAAVLVAVHDGGGGARPPELQASVVQLVSRHGEVEAAEGGVGGVAAGYRGSEIL